MQPGQFNLRRRRDGRNAIAELGNFKITNIDEAVTFVDILEKKLPELKSVLSRTRSGQAFAASRASVAAQQTTQAEVQQPQTAAPDGTSQNTAIQSLEAPAPTEAQRLAQLKASLSPDASFQPDPVTPVAPEPVTNLTDGSSTPEHTELQGAQENEDDTTNTPATITPPLPELGSLAALGSDGEGSGVEDKPVAKKPAAKRKPAKRKAAKKSVKK